MQCVVLRDASVLGAENSHMKKKNRGCTLELLKKICKRDPVLWAWLELFSPLQLYIVTETFNLFNISP